MTSPQDPEYKRRIIEVSFISVSASCRVLPRVLNTTIPSILPERRNAPFKYPPAISHDFLVLIDGMMAPTWAVADLPTWTPAAKQGPTSMFEQHVEPEIGFAALMDAAPVAERTNSTNASALQRTESVDKAVVCIVSKILLVQLFGSNSASHRMHVRGLLCDTTITSIHACNFTGSRMCQGLTHRQTVLPAGMLQQAEITCGDTDEKEICAMWCSFRFVYPMQVYRCAYSLTHRHVFNSHGCKRCVVGGHACKASDQGDICATTTD